MSVDSRKKIIERKEKHISNIIKYWNRHRNRRKDMTYIIGARCKDGVVLVSDRRVSRGTVIKTGDKLFKPLRNVVIGAAGATGISNTLIESLVGMVNLGHISSTRDFLRAAEDIGLELHQRYAGRVGDLEVLIAIRDGFEAKLYNIDTSSGAHEPVKECIAIGHGEPYGSAWLDNLWKPEMTMEEFSKIACMIIKYIEILDLDNSVGNGYQLFFIPDITNGSVEENEVSSKFPITEKKNDLMIPDFEGTMLIAEEFAETLGRIRDKLNPSSVSEQQNPLSQKPQSPDQPSSQSS